MKAEDVWIVSSWSAIVSLVPALFGLYVPQGNYCWIDNSTWLGIVIESFFVYGIGLLILIIIASRIIKSKFNNKNSSLTESFI